MNAATVPDVIVPETARLPPTKYTTAVPTAATRPSATNRMRL